MLDLSREPTQELHWTFTNSSRTKPNFQRRHRTSGPGSETVHVVFPARIKSDGARAMGGACLAKWTRNWAVHFWEGRMWGHLLPDSAPTLPRAPGLVLSFLLSAPIMSLINLEYRRQFLHRTAWRDKGLQLCVSQESKWLFLFMRGDAAPIRSVLIMWGSCILS